MRTNDRKLYYFHIQHDRCEMDGDCPRTYVNADEEWLAIESTLESLPTPDKMYNDSFVFKSGGSRDEEIIGPLQFMIALVHQNYTSRNSREMVVAQIRKSAGMRHETQSAYLRQLMGHYSALTCFSNNDRLLLKLASRGTNIVACESQVLHQESDRSVSSLTESLGSTCGAQHALNLVRITLQRNDFIAGQIDLTLKPGETGVLFLGHLHGINGHMVKRLTDLGVPVEEMNECRASEALENLFGSSGVASTAILELFGPGK